jgi:hypothetical protein
VIAAIRPQVDLDGQLVLAEYMAHVSLLHDLKDVD